MRARHRGRPPRAASAARADGSRSSSPSDTITPPAGPLRDQVDFLVIVLREADAPRSRRAGAGVALAALAREAGAADFAATGAADAVVTLATATSEPVTVREGALLAVSALARVPGRVCEPALAPAAADLAAAAADKSPDVRAAATDAVTAIAKHGASPSAAGALIDALLPLLEPAAAWGVKCAALAGLRAAAKASPDAATARLPAVVPAVTAMMCDAKADVAKAAAKAGAEALALVGNPDLVPAVPAILGAMAHPATAPECVTRVAGTTFVQPVEAPTLAVLVPLVVRGLRTKHTATVRKTALITANMAKLVYSPRDAEAFFPALLPLLEKAAAETSNPECRAVVEGAVAALRAAADAAGAAPPDAPWTMTDAVEALSAAAEAVGAPLPSASAAAVEWAGTVAAALATDRCFDAGAWRDGVATLLAPYTGLEAAAKVATAALAAARSARGGGGDSSDGGGDDDDPTPKLCECEFSLAYGGKILLSGAKLALRKGARYGLCGANGVGKSTLMRAIADGKVDGFPPRSEVRTAYVESNIDADADVAVSEYVHTHPELVAEGDDRPTLAAVEAALDDVGFDAAGRASPVGALSGGWKMKLALARATLLRADVMLLDEVGGGGREGGGAATGRRARRPSTPTPFSPPTTSTSPTSPGSPPASPRPTRPRASSCRTIPRSWTPSAPTSSTTRTNSSPPTAATSPPL